MKTAVEKTKQVGRTMAMIVAISAGLHLADQPPQRPGGRFHPRLATGEDTVLEEGNAWRRVTRLPSATGTAKRGTRLLWMNEYLMALHEAEKARLASRGRKDHRKEGLSDREPAAHDEQVYPPTNYSKEVTTCP